MSKESAFNRVDEADALAQYAPAQVALSPGLYAIEHIDNWCGEHVACTALARLDEKGIWTYEESGKPVIQHEGDKVFRAWPLVDHSAVVPLDMLTAEQRLHVLNQELQGHPLKAWSVYWDHIVAARSEREALELVIFKMGDRFRDEWNVTLADVCEIEGYEMERRLTLPENGESFQLVFDRATAPGYLGEAIR